MLQSIKTCLKKIPFARSVRDAVRRPPHPDRDEARRIFKDYRLFLRAMDRKGRGTAVLQTHDGLKIVIRQNLWDARIVREMFFDRPYVKDFALPDAPVVVDIGGYIGDFSIYAAKYLGASRVVVYEPTAENFEILRRNIEINGYAERIVAVNRAVSRSHAVELNVQKQEGEEIHVSAYWYPGAERRTVPSITLPELVETHQLDTIDLLKIDCEGGEYDILGDIPDQLLSRVKNLVFEYHEVEGYEPRLQGILDRLRSAGYAVGREGFIVHASRQGRA